MDVTSSSRPLTCPTLIDQRARDTPDRVWAVIPKTENLKDGYRNVTYAQLANGINKVAWWLDQHLPLIGKFDTVLYEGPNDVRWLFMVFATQKTRRTHLILNPNNSIDADVKLMQATNCQMVVVARGSESRPVQLQEKIANLITVPFPDAETFLSNEVVEKYPYEGPATEAEAAKTPWKITHTSGTTGQPKTIPFTVIYQTVMFRHRQVFEQGLHEIETWNASISGQRVLMPFPMTWSVGTAMAGDLALAWDFIPVLFPTHAPQPLPLDIIDDALKYSNATVAMLLPFYLTEMVKRPQYLDTIKQAKLSMLGYVGATLDRSVMDILDPHVESVQPLYGSTDVGYYPIFKANPKEGQYIGFSPTAGCDFEEVGDGLYELVLKRSRDKHRQVYYFIDHPDQDTFRTNDLFRKHPTKQYFWQMAGRADDLIKNNFLTKTHAGSVEGMLVLNQHIRGACFGGQAEKKTYLIVEVDETLRGQSREEIIDTIWPAVQKANESMTAEIALTKSNIIITSAEKPLPRLGKGTINRRIIPEIYKDEIAQVENS